MNAKNTALRANPFLLIGLIVVMSAAPAFAQSPIVITQDESRPLIGSMRVAETFISDMTSMGGMEFAMLQNLAIQQYGANQTWDIWRFSFDPAPRTFTHYFRDFIPSNPGGDVPAYQGANCVGEAPVALNPDLPGDNWAYFFIGNGKLEQHGNLFVGLGHIDHVPPALERAYPIEFGQSWSSSYTRTMVGGPGMSVDVTTTSRVDGWGTLSVPGPISAPALRIKTTTTVGALPPEESIHFVTREGISATIGFNAALAQWESVSYEIETITGGGPGVCGDDAPPEDDEVLFVVDDAANLSNADMLARDLLVSLDLEVMIAGGDAVTTEDANDKELIVVSGSADASVISADWAATAVPLVSWEVGLFDDLQLTGNVQGTDYGITAATNTLTIMDATHPIANGASGDLVVSDGEFPLNYGMPTDAAQTVATANGGNATIFTYDADASLVDGSNAPARRVAFYMDAEGPANATPDGMTLLENALLWALGRR